MSYTKHYDAGSQRINSKLGKGKDREVYLYEFDGYAEIRELQNQE
ncbi:hypothetical protein ACL0VS_17800 [Chryseobacterium sp. PMSZPI]